MCDFVVLRLNENIGVEIFVNRIDLTLSLLLNLIVSGCGKLLEPKISEEEAKSIVLEEYSDDFGEVTILSVSYKEIKYIIEWENKENCEEGTDYIDDQKIRNTNV